MLYLYTQASNPSTDLNRMVRFDVAGANQRFLTGHPCPHFYIRGQLYVALGSPIAFKLTTKPFTLGQDPFPTAAFTFLYTQQKPTANRWRFVVSQQEPEVPLRYHPAPYYYISKTAHADMGRPLALTVAIAPVTLEVGTIFPDLEV
jgi:hypothetical protein